MRDSIGSGMVFSICLTFIIMFTAYLAITLNYAKAFKVKNHILDRIEENEGFTEDIVPGLDAYMLNEGYTAYGACKQYMGDEGETADWVLDECVTNDSVPAGYCSVCLYRKASENQHDIIAATRSYYRVITFFKMDIPVVSAFLPAVQVKGDGRYFYDFANS